MSAKRRTRIAASDSAATTHTIVVSDLRYYNYQSCLQEKKNATNVVFEIDPSPELLFGTISCPGATGTQQNPGLNKWIDILIWNLPRLTHATCRISPTVQNFGYDSTMISNYWSNQFPVNVICTILNNCQNTLISLEILRQSNTNITLTGSPEHFKEMMRCLSKMKKLQRFCLNSGFHWNVSHYTNQLIQNALTNIIVRKETLREVILPRAARLPLSKFLRILKKRNHQNLESLSLSVVVHSSYDDDGGTAGGNDELQQALNNNNSSSSSSCLKKLDLTLETTELVLDVDQEDPRSKTVSGILGSLHGNKSLVSLKIKLVAAQGSIIMDRDTMDTWKVEADSAFPTNTTLKHLDVTVGEVTTNSQQQQQQQQVLQSLQLTNETNFWLKMNRIGLGRNTTSMNNRKWISKLIQHSNDPQAAYFVLSNGLPMFLPYLVDFACKKSTKRMISKRASCYKQQQGRSRKKQRLTDFLRLVGR